VPDLVIYVDGSASDDDKQTCRERFEPLLRREWTYPLTFVDLPDLLTVGIAVDLPDPADAIDRSAVRADVIALVAAVSRLARQSAIEFVIEYRDEPVGILDGGSRDTRFLADYFGEHERSRDWA